MSFTATDVRRALYDGCAGVTELRHFRPGESLGSPDILWHSVDDHDGWAADCLCIRVHRQLYWGVATRKDDSSGKADNCLDLPAFFADLDFKDSSETDVRQRLAAFPLNPSIVIHSGGGLHAYWLPWEPFRLETPDDHKVATTILVGLITALGSDPACKDVSRILRVPNSRNLKHAQPRPVAIETFDPDRRVNPSELHHLLEEIGAFAHVARAVQTSVTTEDGTIPDGQRNATLYAFGRSMHAKGLSVIATTAALKGINATSCRPPLPDAEVEALGRQCASQADRANFIGSPETDPVATADRALEAALVRERATREGAPTAGR